MMTYGGRQPAGARGRVNVTGRGRGDTILNVLIGLMFFGLLAFGILWIIRTGGEAGQQYMNTMINGRDQATDVACRMNLRTISQNLQMYAASNEGLPGSQQELESFSGNPRLFRCPDPNGGEFIYVPGQGGVLVYESKPAHHGRCNVLFRGGQIASLTPDELQQALRR